MNISFKGKMKKVFFQSDTWCSCLVNGEDDELYRLTGKGDIVVTGNFSPVEGAVATFTGETKNNPKYGMQFQAQSVEYDEKDEITIVKFMQTFIKGCGKNTAETIFKNFGDKSLEIIGGDNYEKLTDIKGISKKKAKKFHDSYADATGFIEVFKIFNGQISSNKANRIIDKYGKKSIEIIKDNPYQLIYDLRGFGFKTVDKLALASGITESDPRRVKAAIIFTLETVSQNNGHCYLPVEEIKSNVEAVIKDISIEDDVLVEQIVELQKIEYIHCEEVDDTVRVYLKELYDAEVYLANAINDLRSGFNTKYDEKVIEHCINKMEMSEGYELEPLQKEAVKTSLKNKIALLTGGPGTGKTTVIRAIVDSAVELKMNVTLLAPTGRASRKLAQSCKMEANTICKYNYLNRTVIGEKKVFSNTLFVVDETSMVDLETAQELFTHIGKNSCIVLVGDIDQLPSIGAGNFYRDLIKSRKVATTKLQLTHRFGGCIAKNADAVNKGRFHFETGPDFKEYSVTDPIQRQKMVIDLYLMCLEKLKGDMTKIQIIVPMRQRGECSSNTLNEILRGKLNPYKAGEKSFGSKLFRKNDRVMQTKNNPNLKVANGDCGIVVDFDDEDGVMIVHMDEGFDVRYDENDATDLVIAYAITVHKSQGSEYPVVISAYGQGDYMMLQRNLLYTAITRCKNKFLLVCDKRAIYRAVNNIQPIIRNTSLIEKLT
ncbi:MAG: ATP-dependent RecD-like DNA helicase [Ruminococcus sp.]|nr:ATP-dependent RecD-like DNA helicase [Ruminococcus sp.]